MLEHPKPYVSEELDARSLHFSASAIQSRMQLRRPDALALEYTRTMMAWLMLRPRAQRVALIGLGGGSLVKYCHRRVPQVAIVAVEINPHVIALRDAFDVPHDDARLRVLEADGARFVAQTDERFDVLMIDAFDADAMPAALGTQRFYDDAHDVLRPGGLLVVNLHAGHAHFPVYVERIRARFGVAPLRVDDHDHSNGVIFAAQGGAPLLDGVGASRAAVQASATWPDLHDAFARVAAALQRSDRDGDNLQR
jgi:spermidine synthase